MTFLILLTVRLAFALVVQLVRALVFLLVLVGTAIRHPVRSAITLTRGTTVLLSLGGIVGGIAALILMPQTQFSEWALPIVAIISGFGFSYLYTRMPLPS